MSDTATGAAAGQPGGGVFADGGARRPAPRPVRGLAEGLALNRRLRMDGLELLGRIEAETVAAAFFDPQYRGILDRMRYGNEGKSRGRARSELTQMGPELIRQFVAGLDRVLMRSGHLFLWLDKFHLCSDFSTWLEGTGLEVVDLMTWHKGKMGMGYRTRRTCEYLLVLQKAPRRAKGVWTVRDIPDCWSERISGRVAHHAKPIDLQAALIRATTAPGDLVVDPAAGTFSVLEACRSLPEPRNFLGCDLAG